MCIRDRLCSEHADMTKDLSQEDYLRMDHPVVINTNLFAPPQDLFHVELRQRSKSQLPSDISLIKNTNDTLQQRNSGAGNNKRQRSKSRRAYDTNTKSIGDLSQLVHRNVNLLQDDAIGKSVDFLFGNKGNDAITPPSSNNNKKSVLYNRLMDDVKTMIKRNGGQSFDEDDLIAVDKFNRFEGRLVFHSLQGWLPLLTSPTNSSTSPDKLIEDYTVDELFLYIRSLGNDKLAEYLRMYSVDGFLLMNIVKDDLLLDRMLFDDSFLTVEQLVKLRLAFFPKRPRCNAIEKNGHTDNIVNIL